MSLLDADPAAAQTLARLDLLKALTGIPTASGREHRVVAFVRQWLATRPDLVLSEDPVGNVVISFADLSPKPRGRSRSRRPRAAPPLFITAHLDHPAFVVERVDPVARQVELSFRGGVNEVFFDHAPIILHSAGGPTAATLVGTAPQSSHAGTHYLAEIDGPVSLALPAIGDIATWSMPGPEIDAAGILHAPACDDLAAVAAALSAIDALREPPAANGPRPAGPRPDVRVLLTLAEEIGFIGAIAACRHKTIPRGSVVLALENSRAFPESPVGGGPIVRVGDRLSIFTPWLTAACSDAAEFLFRGAASLSALQSAGHLAKRPWQRKLMAGGACEASVFCHEGFAATCLCLPLGNYHNMPHLERIQAGTYDATQLGPPRCEREFIHTHDYLALVDLLVALGRTPPVAGPASPGGDDFGHRLKKLYDERSFVLPKREPEPTRAPARRRAAQPRKRPRAGTRKR
ncbi:MAG: hypothetical protein AB7K52_04090 [Phycisphaerales bacterium]